MEPRTVPESVDTLSTLHAGDLDEWHNILPREIFDLLQIYLDTLTLTCATYASLSAAFMGQLLAPSTGPTNLDHMFACPLSTSRYLGLQVDSIYEFL